MYIEYIYECCSERLVQEAQLEQLAQLQEAQLEDLVQLQLTRRPGPQRSAQCLRGSA